jgi:hypothetical protein
MAAPTAPPVEGSGAFANSVRVWLGCVAFLVVVELYIVLIGGGLEKDPRIGLFTPPSIAVFGLAGLIGVWLSHRTGFPPAWDSRVGIRQRLFFPILWGIGIGVALVAHDLVFHWTAAYKEIIGATSFNVVAPFPGPLLFYSGGAIIVEVFYRLLPIPLLLWLVSNLALRRRNRESVFWVLAALTSLIEPATQDLAALQRPGLETAAATVFGIDYVLNLVQAVTFRRYGFLAAIVVRISTYVVWHLIYGNYICAC